LSIARNRQNVEVSAGSLTAGSGGNGAAARRPRRLTLVAGGRKPGDQNYNYGRKPGR